MIVCAFVTVVPKPFAVGTIVITAVTSNHFTTRFDLVVFSAH